MAESVSTSLPMPNILWKIPNFSTCGRTYCTLSFLGTSWKLIFDPISDSGGKRIIFRLMCLNASENLKTLELCSHCGIFVSFASSGVKLGEITKMNLKDQEWCVWSHPLETITSKFGKTYIDLWFTFRIFPDEIKKQSMTLEKIRQQAEEEKVKCPTILFNDFSKLYNNSEHSDFELRCKELRLPVHKAILSVRSGYFAALFRSHMKEADKGYVEFDDIDPKNLQHVIYYFYSGKLPELPGNAIRDVYAIADRFDIESLRMECVSLLMADFMKEPQTKTEKDTLEEDNVNQKMENLPVSCNDKRNNLLKQLFRSYEWIILSEDDPAVAEKMCKPILLDIPKIESIKK